MASFRLNGLSWELVLSRFSLPHLSSIFNFQSSNALFFPTSESSLVGSAVFSLTVGLISQYHWYRQLCHETNHSLHIYSKYAKQLSKQEEEYYSQEILQETSYKSLLIGGEPTTAAAAAVPTTTMTISGKEMKLEEEIKRKKSLDLYEKVKSVLAKNPYYPSFYALYDIHGQLQTSIQFFIRNVMRVLFQTILFQQTEYYIQYDRELIKLPDQGTIAIDWVLNCSEGQEDSETSDESSLKGESKPVKPILIIHHGVNGDSQSEYFYHLLAKLCRQKLYSKIGVLIARGCGGLPLTSFTTFSGRRSYDLYYVVKYIKNLYPKNKLFWIGYSLGAAITLHYLEDFPDFIEEEQVEEDLVEERNQNPLSVSRIPSSDRLVLDELEATPFTIKNLQKHNLSNANSRNNSIRDFLALEASYTTTAATLAQQQRKEQLERRKEKQNSGIDAALCVSPPWNLDRQALGFNLWSILILIPLKLYYLQHLDELKLYYPFFNNPEVEQVTMSQLLSLLDINALDRICWRFYGAEYSLESLKKSSEHLEYVSPLHHSPFHVKKEEGEGVKHPLVKNHEVETDQKHHVHIRYKDSADNCANKIRSDSLNTNVSNDNMCNFKSLRSQSIADVTDTSGVTISADDEEAAALAAKEALEVNAQNLPNDNSFIRYKSLEEYYLDASPKYKAHQVTTPTLAISSRDDPICAHEECPQDSHEVGPGLVIVTTKYGGHLAFPNGIFTFTDSWIDNIVVDWFDQFR